MNNMDKFTADRINSSLIVMLSAVFTVFLPWFPATASSQDLLKPHTSLEEAQIEFVELAQRAEEIEEVDTDTAAQLSSDSGEQTPQVPLTQPEAGEIGETDTVTALQLSSDPDEKILQADQTEPGTEEISAVEDTETSQDYEDIKFEIKRNSRVEHYIRRFSGKGKEGFATILNRSGKFLPEIKKTLLSEGIPSDIAYLPLIESGFNPRAVSRKSAVGLWQFIRPTGLRYGLKVNYWVDERMDVEKSTLAAARYLKEMFDEFGSWELALAAYNCGESRVSKAITRTGSTDFWTLSRKLPRETRNYLPKFNAALIIAKNPEKYGFRIMEAEKDYETVNVPPRKSLAEIANLLDMGYKEISRYNPSLIGLTTPPGESYELKVPKGYGEKLVSVQSQVVALKDIEIPFRTRPTRYTVKPDDSLWKIARRFGTSIEKLKYANRLSSSIIRPGQRLKIPTRGNVVYVKHKIRPGENIYVLAKKYGVSIDEIKRANNLKGSLIIAGKTLSIPQRLSSTYVQRDVPRKMSHKIIPGDTLSELALRYRVSVSQIKRWNNLSSTTLIAGRNLVIYK